KNDNSLLLHSTPTMYKWKTLVRSLALKRQLSGSTLQSDHYVQVPDRSLVEINGEDGVKFLQGLITNHMPSIQSGGDGFYSAFLNPVGRVLYDTFVYPKNVGTTFPHQIYLVECDSRIVSDLIKHMKKYVLRSKVSISDVSSQYNVWNMWGGNIDNLWWRYQVPNPSATKLPIGSLVLKERIAEIGCKDKRCPYMGLRFVLPFDTTPSVPSSFKQLPSNEYKIRRILYGIPEGIEDLPLGSSLPLQCNFDYMRGIDWHKGCYIGQELTFRTYHVGVTRKRIIPVQLVHQDESLPTTLQVDRTVDFPLPPPSTGIYASIETLSKKSRPIGAIGSSCHNVALALLNLDKVQDENLIVASGRGEVYRVKPFVPDWWPK
ncbi:32541_t:CDS:2, partial [Racocetra persica]